MKEEFQPLEPVGNEPTETRIVAWVHGEVSPAEAAELERLCAHRPDLEQFRQQIADLHGLLGDASAEEDAWKLSAERRERVEAVLSGQHATVSHPVSRHPRQWVKPVLLAAAACVTLAAGFHFIIGPVGNNTFVHKPTELPVVAAAPKIEKKAGDFRREIVPHSIDGASKFDDELPALAASADMAEVDTPSANHWMEKAEVADRAVAAFATAEPQPTAKPMAEESGRTDKAPEIVAGMAPSRRPPAAASMELRKRSAGEQTLEEEVGRKLRTSNALREYGWRFEAVTTESATSDSKDSAEWRLRPVAGKRDETISLRLSDASQAREYRLSSGRTVKLLATDATGADCAGKKLESNGKATTVDALVREILAME